MSSLRKTPQPDLAAAASEVVKGNGEKNIIFNPFAFFGLVRTLGESGGELNLNWYIKCLFMHIFSPLGLNYIKGSFYHIDFNNFRGDKVKSDFLIANYTFGTFLRAIFFMPGLIKKRKLGDSPGSKTKEQVLINYDGLWFEWLIFVFAAVVFPIPLMLAALKLLRYGLGCLRLFYTKFVLELLWRTLVSKRFWIRSGGIGALITSVIYFFILIPIYEVFAIAEAALSWATSPINTFVDAWDSSPIIGKIYALIGAIFALGAIGAMCIFAPYVIGLLLGLFGIGGVFTFLSSLVTYLVPELVALLGGVFGEFTAMTAFAISVEAVFAISYVVTAAIFEITASEMVAAVKPKEEQTAKTAGAVAESKEGIYIGPGIDQNAIRDQYYTVTGINAHDPIRAEWELPEHPNAGSNGSSSRSSVATPTKPRPTPSSSGNRQHLTKPGLGVKPPVTDVLAMLRLFGQSAQHRHEQTLNRASPVQQPATRSVDKNKNRVSEMRPSQIIRPAAEVDADEKLTHDRRDSSSWSTATSDQVETLRDEFGEPYDTQEDGKLSPVDENDAVSP